MRIVLLKFPGERVGLEQVRPVLQSESASWVEEEASLRIYHAVEFAETYAYVQFSVLHNEFQSIKDDVCQALHRALAVAHPLVEVVSLQRTLEVAGHSAGKPSGWHYVVETDVQPGAEGDFNDWYSTEHLPGLAAVPGTVVARRYISCAGSPKHYATYDLETIETFGSEPWVAVRATDWSSRVRPNFVNTKRTMFRRASDSLLKEE
ncbi:MAG TPA: hypothetical protein VIP51_15975 [Eoetvoesiella sp.]